jgi:signal transduction histidine kinase
MAVGDGRGRGFGQYSQRLAYLLIALALAATVVGATVAGFRLHHAVLIERQTLRIQAFAQKTLELQNIALAAQAQMRVSPALAAKRKSAVADVDATFASVQAHDPAEGARLETAYHVYVARSTVAFIAASRNAGTAPNALEQLVQHSLAVLQSLIGDEIANRAAASERANPASRRALIATAVAVGLLVVLLVWQFELERRAGRIDRDNAYRAEELARLRDEFVAVVSHELRTPLTSIVGYLELLDDDGTDNLTADQKSYLEVVRRSTFRLGELVGDLLLVAEAERAPLALELGAVDVATLAAHAVEAAQPVADARRIDLRLETDEAGSLRADPTRLAQMLDNLVSNALKFTPEGGQVTVRAESRGGHTLFAVSDTGHGIGATDRARLFEPFYRARTATEHAVPGTGLGLTITKAIVDAHRGTIEVESVPRAGTTFRVRIPEA